MSGRLFSKITFFTFKFENNVKPKIEEDGSTVGDNALFVEYFKYHGLGARDKFDLLVTISSEKIEETLEKSFRNVEREFYENNDFSSALLETGTNMDRDERIEKAKPEYKIVGQYKDIETADEIFDSLATKYLTEGIPNKLRQCSNEVSDSTRKLQEVVAELKKEEAEKK